MDEVSFGLRRTATAQERVRALLSYRLTVDDLGDATGKSENAVRNWASGQSEPRRRAEFALDALRETVLILIETDVEPREARNWLRSRDSAVLEGERPLDVLKRDPLLVFATARTLNPQPPPGAKTADLRVVRG